MTLIDLAIVQQPAYRNQYKDWATAWSPEGS